MDASFLVSYFFLIEECCDALCRCSRRVLVVQAFDNARNTDEPDDVMTSLWCCGSHLRTVQSTVQYRRSCQPHQQKIPTQLLFAPRILLLNQLCKVTAHFVGRHFFSCFHSGNCRGILRHMSPDCCFVTMQIRIDSSWLCWITQHVDVCCIS